MELKVIVWAKLSQQEQKRILNRSEAIVDSLLDDAGIIIEAVKERGDSALIDLTTRFDKVDLTGFSLRFTED